MAELSAASEMFPHSGSPFPETESVRRRAVQQPLLDEADEELAANRFHDGNESCHYPFS